MIKYSSQIIDDHLYYDAKHAAREETDYMLRVDSEKQKDYTMESYNNKAAHFGTLAVMMVPDGISPKQAYDDYKSRCEVEQEIDVLKTDLDALTSYMRDNDRLEDWMFINFIALHIFYMIRKRIAEKDMASKISMREAVRILCRQRIVRLDNEWSYAKISKNDKAQLEALSIPIT